jgi:hypothetical protein
MDDWNHSATTETAPSDPQPNHPRPLTAP